MSSSMASPSPSPSSPKLCFNSNCKEVLERSRRGWRRRTGGYADLCDRCASVFEEGNFCESFHLSASGWRCCESCGKQIHCGCIVSFHMFVLLDAGGIECITCARKSFILTPNPAWPPPSRILPELPDRIKDLSLKNWSSIAGSGPAPWQQAPSSFNNSIAQSELNPKMSFEVDIPGGIDRLLSGERFYASSLDNKKNGDSLERFMNGNLKTGALQIFENGTSGSKCEEQLNPYVNVTQQSTFSNNEPSSIPHFSSTLNPALKTETTQRTKAGTHVQRLIPPPAAVNQFSSPNGVDSSGEAQTRSGRPRGDSRGRNQLLPRYWPRITDQELQQISGDFNYVITPLFEKMLSASDAGRIGRLVLPKKCAEAYFPTISNPEGIPLMVQDLKGKEWVFQFRFWPNNNSRMYVLEGVTPCIQSMQLQAGDTVTFSRLEPEGKLVMGCRKTSAPPSDQPQNKESINIGNEVSTHGDASTKATKPGEVVSVRRHSKGNSVSSLLAINQANSVDPSSTWSEVEKSKYTAREVPGKPVFHSKRKNNTLGSKSKRLRIENEDMIELKLTWEEAQGLFRPPPNLVPRIVVIEGCEFEEFEEPPIIGRPTILAIDHMGGKIQWAQCEDCFKWRKVPSDVLLPSRWTCSDNLWDPERSLCSAAQELTQEELEDLLSTGNQAGAKKIKVDKEEFDSLEALEGLDALANLAILEEGDALPSSSQVTTKHPRHRPGCTCIVCIQPPSGKGPKHKQTCTCNVCLTVKRRFWTLMLRCEQKQSEKEAETACQKLQLPEQLADEDILPCSDTGNCSLSHKMVINEVSDDDRNKRESSTSPFKVQIDLNIQPEREEDLSPISDSGGMMRLLQDATERYLKQQKISSSVGNRNSVTSQAHPAGVQAGNLSNVVIPLDSSHQNGDSDHPVTL